MRAHSAISKPTKVKEKIGGKNNTTDRYHSKVSQ